MALTKIGGRIGKFFEEHPFWEAVILDTAVQKGLKLGAQILAGKVEERVENNKQKVKDKFCFTEALNWLAANDPYSHDVISDFIAVGLDNETDRADFEVNAARVGEDLQGTVQHLQRLAKFYPDHAARKAHLDEIGHIGKRSVDPLEHTQAAAKAVGRGIAVGATAVGHGAAVVVAGTIEVVNDGLDKLEDSLVDPPTPENPTGNKATAFRNKWKAQHEKLTR